MWRAVAWTLVCTLLGAATTIGIAWACAAWVDIEIGERELTHAELRPYRRDAFSHPLPGSTRAWVVDRPGHTRITLMNGDFGECLIVYATLDERRAGWPWRALSCSRHGWSSPIEGGFELQGATIVQWRALPYAPIWSGLGANIVLFGSAWGALLVGLPRLRKRIRFRRGLCPK